MDGILFFGVLFFDGRQVLNLSNEKGGHDDLMLDSV